MKVLASYINPIGIENKILEYCQIPIPNRYEEVGNPHYMYLKWYIYIYIYMMLVQQWLVPRKTEFADGFAYAKLYIPRLTSCALTHNFV